MLIIQTGQLMIGDFHSIRFSALTAAPGCIIHFRKYGLPYGLSVSLCTLHLMVTHFDATLGMGGWLDLTQQGLSPCKKYRASWRSSAKSLRIIEPVQTLSEFMLSKKNILFVYFYLIKIAVPIISRNISIFFYSSP